MGRRVTRSGRSTELLPGTLDLLILRALRTGTRMIGAIHAVLRFA